MDIALLIESGDLDRRRILDALSLTFERRGTHQLTAGLIPPPAAWQIPFQALAEECGLSSDMNATFRVVQQFFTDLFPGPCEQ